jgi:putative ABC transport system permease protein
VTPPHHESSPRLALFLVGIASRLVTRSKRAPWRLEWEGEILARWDALVRRGETSAGARLDLAWRAVGSVVDALLYEKGRWRMDGMMQDVFVAARTLAHKPALAIVVVATLAVGIGANTAMFSVAKDVLLRPFPYPEPDKVVAVEGVAPGGSGNVAYPNIHDLDLSTTSFDAIGATRWWSPALEDDRGSLVPRGAVVTSNYFSILGVEPGLGRFFRPDEQGDGRADLVVLTHAFWTDHFGGDPSVVGRDIRLSGVPYRVIGVTAEDFEDPWIMDGPGLEPQIFRTVASPPSEWPRSGRSWKGIARVRSDVTVEAAQDEIASAFAGLAEAYPEHNANRTLRLVPLRDRIAGSARPIFMTLLAAVGLLLLIACANLANLLLGRALDRQGEFAVHKALGAAGWRLFNRGLAEAGVLSVVGGALGLALAVWLVKLAQGLGSMLPRPVTGEVDPALLGFVAAVTIGAGLLFGLAPALHAARTQVANPGRDVGRAMTMSRRGHGLRRALVVGELALTTALLVGAGLLVRSYQRLGRVDLGLEPEGVVSVELHGSAWWELEPEEALGQWHAVMDAVRAVPGVQAAGAIDYVPFTGSYSCDGVQRDDVPPPEPGEGMCAETRMILPGTLEALDVPLVRGRLLGRTDLTDQPSVVVIDQNLAEALWPGEDPIGKGMLVHTNVHQVVGIAANMRHFGPAGDVRPQLYLHAPQDGWNGVQRGLHVIARGADAAGLITPIRQAVADVNVSIAVGTAETLEGLLSTSLSAERFRTWLMVSFGFTALLLATLGIAGVMSYSVSRRTREMGVRLALGAEPGVVRGLVLREGVRLGVLGVGLGLIVALSLAGAIDQALLFEVGARDPGVYTLVVLLLGVATAVACYAPASRASSVDPVTALAAE